MRKKTIFSCIDGGIILIYFLLVVFGWLNIYSSSYNFDHASILSFDSRSGKQLMWFGFSVLIALFILLSDEHIYEDLAVPIYLGIVLLLIATIFLAPDIKGSRSWLVIGPFSLQPAEFAKFATALMVAKIASHYQFAIKKVKYLLLVGLVLATPFLLIILQSETGTALVFSSFLIVLYRLGLSPVWMAAVFYAIIYFVLAVKYGFEMIGNTAIGNLLCAIIALGVFIYHLSFVKRNTRHIQLVLLIFSLVTAIGVILSNFFIIDVSYFMYGGLLLSGAYTLFVAIHKQYKPYLFAVLFMLGSIFYIFSVDYVFDNILQPHQQTRIKVAFGIEEDLRGAGYNVNQSLIAIGSGGLVGKGYLNGTQTKLKFVPEQATDFIFCTVGEEWGFLGSIFVVGLYAFLIIKLIQAAERQTMAFARVYGYAVVSIFSFHFLVNIGMVLGIIPVIGIPLPFFSYGGSSLMAFTILLFIFLKMDASRKL